MLDINKFFNNFIEKSFGCTEPAAIGLSVSIAFNVLKGKLPIWLEKKYLNKSPLNFEKDIKIENIKKAVIKLDKDTYRNALEVIIPNSGDLKGCQYISALGLFSDPDKKLELFRGLTEDIILKTYQLIKEGKIEVIPMYDWEDFEIRTEVITNNHKSITKIIGRHSNVVFIQVDDKIIFDKTIRNQSENLISKQLIKFEILDFIKIIEDLPEESKKLLKESIITNKKAFKKAKKIFKERGNKSIGLTLKNLIEKSFLPNDLTNAAKYRVATAIEGRMIGFPIEVMTCGGSGNMGLTSTLTLMELSKRYSNDDEKLIRSLALTFLIASYISKYCGYLSALCSCNIKIGVALASGIAYYLIEDNTEESKKIKIIGSAINNIIGDITGIICDGAKKTCSLKAITAVDAAITSAFLALNGIEMLHDLGVVNKNPLFSIKNIGIISKGMKETDKKIIKEILNKNFSKYLKSRN
jgi:L-cysteine desulfidase